MRTVRVLPQAVGWIVEGFGEPQFFHSGSRAEKAARRLAAAMAASGGPAEIQVVDRSGQLVGRLRMGLGAHPAWEMAAQ
jgi:hypothetical protein